MRKTVSPISALPEAPMLPMLWCELIRLKPGEFPSSRVSTPAHMYGTTRFSQLHAPREGPRQRKRTREWGEHAVTQRSGLGRAKHEATIPIAEV